MAKYIADREGYINERVVKPGEVFDWSGPPEKEGQWFHKVGEKPKLREVNVERELLDGVYAVNRLKSAADAAADDRNQVTSQIAALTEHAQAQAREIAALGDAMSELRAESAKLADEVAKRDVKLLELEKENAALKAKKGGSGAAS